MTENQSLGVGCANRIGMMIITELRDCAARGMTRREAATHVGVSYQICVSQAHRNGIIFSHASTCRVDLGRAMRMAEAYVNGISLENIGHEHGITRERVRQIIKKQFGMVGRDGGATVRAARRAVVRAAAVSRGVVVCAWGAHKRAEGVAPGVLSVIGRPILHKRWVYCFGRTKSGTPRHPLYIKTGTDLEGYWERNT